MVVYPERRYSLSSSLLYLYLSISICLVFSVLTLSLFIAPIDTHLLEKALANYGGQLYKDNFWMAPSELESIDAMHTWYHDQKLGDCVIVPPSVPHTVVNEVFYQS